jgi:acyl-CoA oxidase
MPGITIGDIGKKMGRDGIDNGYIQVSLAEFMPAQSS